MAQLKRILAGALSLCMVGSVLTACGDTDSSTAPGANNSGSGDNKGEERQVTTDIHGKESSEESKNTYTIYCWNTEFKERLDKYYTKENGAKFDITYSTYEKKDETTGKVTEMQQIDTIDGKKVKWVQNENTGNVYQTKLDEALKKQPDSEDKVDMFLIEADYALKYINGNVALSIQDLGITEDELANQYKYTKDVATDTATGELKGVSWQATPGCFMYNAKIAKEVLGTDDPAEVQKAVADWDKFTETAQKMADKGYKMLSGYDDAYRVFSTSVEKPWVDANSQITIDPQIKAWVDQTKDYTDKGYNNGTSLWDTAWAAGQKIDGGVFGYFFSTWGIAFTLLGNTGEEGYGNWRATEGPSAYFWGGTWMCGAIDADNNDITADIMRVLTCNTDTMKKITEGEQDYTNNKEAIKQLCDEGYKNDFLGGQNHLALLTSLADKIDLSNKLSAYDQGCTEKIQSAMKSYFLGESTYEQAVETFKKDITALYGNLKTDNLK